MFEVSKILASAYINIYMIFHSNSFKYFIFDTACFVQFPELGQLQCDLVPKNLRGFKYCVLKLHVLETCMEL